MFVQVVTTFVYNTFSIHHTDLLFLYTQMHQQTHGCHRCRTGTQTNDFNLIQLFTL